jgi:hypothetical protein
MKKISKAQRDKGLEVARDLVSEVPLKDVWDHVAQYIDDRQDEEIPAAIDPSAARDEQVIETLREKFLSMLNEEQQEEFFGLENSWHTRVYWRSIAGFYLGVAFAGRVSGRRLP